MLFYVWGDARVWAHWHHSCHMHLSSLGPAFCHWIFLSISSWFTRGSGRRSSRRLMTAGRQVLFFPDSTHGHHQMVNTEIRLIIFFAAKDGEALYSQQNKTGNWLWLRSWSPYCKIQIKLKKVGKTTRPFRYDLNQISYDYRVEVRNRFKGLDLIERAPEELWTEIREL